jgi:hypothetical protein
MTDRTSFLVVITRLRQLQNDIEPQRRGALCASPNAWKIRSIRNMRLKISEAAAPLRTDFHDCAAHRADNLD